MVPSLNFPRRPGRAALIIVALFLALCAAPAGAQQIAAVVNDRAITTTDVEGRLALAIAAANLPDSPDLRQRLLPEVLRALIDEQLQIQEATRAGIAVTEEEVDAAYAQLAEQNGQTAQSFSAMLTSRGVPPRAMRDQLRAQLAWGRVVQRRLRPRIQVAEDEVDAELEQLRAAAGQPEWRAAELFLAFDGERSEADSLQLAGRLLERVRQGANFAAVAREFSDSATAGVGGDLGWVRAGQLVPALDEVLQRLEAGQLAGPVRTQSGVYLLLAREKRVREALQAPVAIVELSRLLVRPPAGAAEPIPAALDRAAGLRARIRTCEDMRRLAADEGDESVGALGEVRVPDLPQELRQAIEPLAVNEVSEAVPTDAGALLLMVCRRTTREGGLPSRDEVANVIGQRRLDLLAERFLRDLRGSALIDVRV